MMQMPYSKTGTSSGHSPQQYPPYPPAYHQHQQQHQFHQQQQHQQQHQVHQQQRQPQEYSHSLHSAPYVAHYHNARPSHLNSMPHYGGAYPAAYHPRNAYSRATASPPPPLISSHTAVTTMARRMPASDHKATFRGGSCTCKKSKCLKLYCQCFASSTTCASQCKCGGCQNTTEHGREIQAARMAILERNPSAFDDKFTSHKPNPVMSRPHAVIPYHAAPLYHATPPPPPPYHSNAVVTPPHAATPPHSQQQYHMAPPSALQPFPPLGPKEAQPKKMLPGRIHSNGCKCRKSKCLKKYCECFQNESFCGMHCKCINCQNAFAPHEKTTQQTTMVPTTHHPVANDDALSSSSTISTHESSKEDTEDAMEQVAKPDRHESLATGFVRTPGARRVSQSPGALENKVATANKRPTSWQQESKKGPPPPTEVSFQVDSPPKTHSPKAVPVVSSPGNLNEIKDKEENNDNAKKNGLDIMAAAIAMTELFGGVSSKPSPSIPNTDTQNQSNSSLTVIKRKSPCCDARLPPKKRRTPSPRTLSNADEEEKAATRQVQRLTLDSRNPSPSYRSSPPPTADDAPAIMSPPPLGLFSAPSKEGTKPVLHYTHPTPSPPRGNDNALYSHQHGTLNNHFTYAFPHPHPPPHHSYTSPFVLQYPPRAPPTTPKELPKENPATNSLELPRSLSFRKICSKCGKPRSEHDGHGFGSVCLFQECGRCRAGIEMHQNAGQPMGFLCQLTVEQGAKPGANAAYERQITELAAHADLKKQQQQQAKGEKKQKKSFKGSVKPATTN